MLISMIVAMDPRGLIGDGAGMPWRLPSDLRRFRALTMGKPILMGRKTFESLGRPLPGRLNIVLTHHPDFTAAGCRVVATLPNALSVAENYAASTDSDEAIIIGGGNLYAQAMDFWDRLYITLVEGEFTGNTYFPLQELLRQSWRPLCPPETREPDERDPHPHSFHIIERVRDEKRQDCPPADASRSAAHTQSWAIKEIPHLSDRLAVGNVGDERESS